MSEGLAKIYEVQELDTAILEIKRKISHLDNGKELLERVNKAKADHEQADKSLHKLNAELKDTELELKSVEDKKDKFEKRMFSGSITNPKELDNTEKEVAALNRQRGKLDDKILTLWEQVEEAKSIETVAKTEREVHEKSYEAHMARYNAQKSQLEREWVQLDAKRKATAATADAQLLGRYDYIRNKYGGVGMSKVVDNSCGACKTTIPSFNINRLKEGNNQIILCENCNRILFYQE